MSRIWIGGATSRGNEEWVGGATCRRNDEDYN